MAKESTTKKKEAPKKAAPKKAAAKKVTGKKKAASAAFNILARGAMLTNSIRESLVRAKEKPKGFMHRYSLIPIPDLQFQHLLGLPGLVSGTVLDIIGPEGIGKTTLAFRLLGWGAIANCVPVYLESENKEMTPDRIKQALHPDRRIADAIFKSIYMEKVFELSNIVDTIERTAMTLRNPDSKSYVPIENPIMFVVDTFSKALNPAEAAAFQAYISDGLVKRALKEKDLDNVGGGSNMGHAKLAHAWCRRLPHFLHHYNAVLILIRHQNEDVDMTGRKGGGSFVPQDYKDSVNRKSIGGKAVGQNAALQIVLSPKGHVQVAQGTGKVNVARRVLATATKNSFAPERKIQYCLTLMTREQTEHFQEPAITTWLPLAELLQEKKLLKVSVENVNSVTCPLMGMTKVLPSIFHGMLHANPDLYARAQRELDIKGAEECFKVLKQLDTDGDEEEEPETPAEQDKSNETTEPADRPVGELQPPSAADQPGGDDGVAGTEK